MVGFFPDAGLIFQLLQIVSSGLHLHLFTNNVTPSDSTVLSGLTEAAWGGYAKISLVAGSWVSLGVSSHIGTIVYPLCTFSNTSGGTPSFYGWYITDTTDAVLVAVGLADGAPVVLAATTGSWSMIPTLGNQDSI